jgi:hypothetical protein
MTDNPPNASLGSCNIQRVPHIVPPVDRLLMRRFGSKIRQRMSRLALDLLNLVVRMPYCNDLIFPMMF